jgi:putative ABC transport system permease protein
MEAAIKEQLSSMGTNKIMVSPGSGAFGMSALGTSAKLTNEDMEVIQKVSGVKYATGMIYGSERVKYQKESKYTFVIGLPLDTESLKLFQDMQGFEIAEGRFMNDGSANEIVIGWNLAYNDFFKRNAGIGKNIEIQGEKFKIVGIMNKIGNPQDDSQVYISIDAAQTLFDKKDEYDMILVQTKEDNVDSIAEDIKKKLRDFRDEKKGEETFQVQTFEKMIESVGSILAMVRTVIVAIAAISLLVGGIGIMNTMYTAILERTKEIGTMKAVGARNSDIMMIFLFESGIYGLVGGIGGVSIGLGLGKLTEIIARNYLGVAYIKASFAWWLIVGALLFSFITGCLSGVAPAIQASRMKPVQALRYE